MTETYNLAKYVAVNLPDGALLLKFFNRFAMMFRLFLLITFLTAPAAYAQDKETDWINNNAYELKSDSASGSDDLRFLSEELRGKTVVGLGEATHGTREFFAMKRRIIESLVSRHGFRLLAFEFTDAAIAPINQYLQSGQGDLRQLMKPLGLYNTEELYTLFRWIRQYNSTKPAQDRVVLNGLDREEYWQDALTRDKFMADNLVEAHAARGGKSIVWAHNVHVAKDTTMARFPAMGSHLKQQFGGKFFVIGFDTYQGTVNVLNGGKFEEHAFEAKENSLSGIFAKARSEAFFLPFKTDPGPFTGMAGDITHIGSSWQEPTSLPIRPGVDFDGIIFIRNTTASKELNQ